MEKMSIENLITKNSEADRSFTEGEKRGIFAIDQIAAEMLERLNPDKN